MAAAVEDGRLVLLDPDRGQVLSTLEPRQGAVNSVVYSPDGRLIASAGANGDIVTWDAATLTEIRRLRGHEGAVYRIAFSPDGRLLASGGHDKSARIWDVATGMERNNFPRHPGPVVSVAFSPDGRVLVSSSLRATLRTGKTLILHEVATGRALMQLTPHRYRGFGRSETIYMASYSPDGRQLATGSDNREIILWDNLVSDTVHLMEAHQKAVMALAFSPDGRLLASGGLDGRTLLWNAESGRVDIELPPAPDWILSVAFSPNGRRLAASAKDGSIRIWDVSAAAARAARPLDTAIADARSPTGETEAPSAGRTVLFELTPGSLGTGEMSINPFAVFEGGRFVSPLEGFIPRGGFNASGNSREASRRVLQTYFPPRASVAVIRGGVRIGTAVVNRLDYDARDLFDGCFLGFGATARGSFTAPPRAQRFIGVTDGHRFAEGRSLRRAAMPAEKVAFLRTAREVLHERGAPAAALATLAVVTDGDHDVEVLNVDRDGSLELVGSVAAHGASSQHNLFLIVRTAAVGNTPLLVSYHRSPFPRADNASYETEQFVDHLDVDGDGADEIVATKQQYEGMYFVIFKRSGSDWSIVYTGGGGGC